MKRILGLDLGTTSIGWAVVNEAEDASESSSIVRMGVRVTPLSNDEQTKFEKGQPITTNADRTLKRSMRRNLQRYKLRRDNLISLLKGCGWITDQTILSEHGNNSTFETYRIREKAASHEITLEQFARVLLMLNKKRGYRSSRKSKKTEDGQLINAIDVAKEMYDSNLTPGQYGYKIIQSGKPYIPDFYRSDLQSELDKIWSYQFQYHNSILTPEFRAAINNQSKDGTKKAFFKEYHLYTADIKGNRFEKTKKLYQFRNDALCHKLTSEELATVICEVNGQINNSSGYLGAISDRSKILYLNHLTIGQWLMQQLNNNPNASLKNKPFYRQDYLDEFEQLWETQALYHPELTPTLKHEIRDIIIFYQRKLKSQKGLVANCPLEHRKVCPKSAPLFQHFRIWNTLNNIKVFKDNKEYTLNEDQKSILASELLYKEKISKTDALKLLFSKSKGVDMNYTSIEGDRTMAQLLNTAQEIISLSGHGEFDFSKLPADKILETIRIIFGGLGYSTDWLVFNPEATNTEDEPQMRLWHLLYSFEDDNSTTGDEKLIQHLMSLLNLPREFARLFANIRLEEDYCSLSSKAIKKILPFLTAGHTYSEALVLAGYTLPDQSLTKEENEKRQLKDHLAQLQRNSLRNPVVEKILNQMVNVVNGVIDTYGRPDEIRVELARELKKNASERQAMSDAINRNTREAEQCREILQKEFGLTHVSKNDILRYRLYKELAANGYKTLYSNQYIPQEKLFSKEIDIEHIIPQSRLFDDSFSNKTLEYRSVNIDKSNSTALDYVRHKYGEEGVADYMDRISKLFKCGAISIAKTRKLKLSKDDIPQDFIDRDLRNTQYISKKALEMLRDVSRVVTATTGSVTDRLRQDWQLVDLMQELNWEKYQRQGLTTIITGRDGQQIRRITDWTKRNDHRHHAMDALTVAFTKPAYINYLNHLNAHTEGDLQLIERKDLERDANNHLRFKSPVPGNFRAEAKRHLEMILVSIKAKNKVVTRNTNITKDKVGSKKRIQLTPRGQLHKDTIYGVIKVPKTKVVSVDGKMTAEIIAQIQNPKYRLLLQKRLHQFNEEPQKAFTGKNSLDKNPIWIDEAHLECVPDQVTIQWYDQQFTIRKPVDKDLNIKKVIDGRVKSLLESRLEAYNNDQGKAFADLDNNPIWLNQEKGIDIKRVTIAENITGKHLHDKHDKDGKLIFDKRGNPIPVDYVNLKNNHHVAIYQDADGNLQEHIVSFYEAVARVVELGLPVIDKDYNKDKGWQFLFTMKQNEYFIFPNPAQSFDPNEIDLTNERNYNLISPNLFRVQKLSSKDYWFRHHLETTVDTKKELQGVTWKRISSLTDLKGIVKVRINHIGQIVHIGEY